MRIRYGRERPVCVECDHTVFFDPKVAAVAFVTRENDGIMEVLLVKRLFDPGKGKWSLPAGFVEPDEDPRAAAERETLEETGMILRADRLIEVLHRPDVDGYADIVIAYGGAVVGGELNAQDDAEAVGWFGRDNLPEISLESARRLITAWLDGRL
jgi:ADP-ribose pyrophosphatase YjhB (NUDIX family)